MDQKQLESEVKRLMELDEVALGQALVKAVAVDEEFLASLPVTVPRQPAAQVFASMPFSEKFERVKRALEEGFEKNRKVLYELVCVKFDYCNKKGEGEVKLVCGILGVLLGKGIILAAYPKLWIVPIVIMYLYKNGFFDRLCQCPKK